MNGGSITNTPTLLSNMYSLSRVIGHVQSVNCVRTTNGGGECPVSTPVKNRDLGVRNTDWLSYKKFMVDHRHVLSLEVLLSFYICGPS